MGNCASAKSKGGAAQGPAVQQPLARPIKTEESTPRLDTATKLEKVEDDRQQLNTDRPAHRVNDAEEKQEEKAGIEEKKVVEEQK